jgi:hypothetical protein
MAHAVLVKLLAEKRRSRQAPRSACPALALLALSAEIDAFASAASPDPTTTPTVRLIGHWEGPLLFPA